MAGVGVKRIDESVTVVGSSNRSVMERVEISVRGLKGYTSARPSMDVVHIAFVVNKLFGSKTHVCTVTVSNDPRRVIVSIQGELEESRINPLRAAILGTSVEGLRDADPGTFGPPPSAASPSPAMYPPVNQTLVAGPVAGLTSYAVQPQPKPQPQVQSQTPSASVPSLRAQPPVQSPSGSADPSRGVVQPTSAWFLSDNLQQRNPQQSNPQQSNPQQSNPQQSNPQQSNPPPSDAVEDSRTIVRPYGQKIPRSAPPPSPTVAGRRPTLVAVGDGQRFELTPRMLVGRDPVGRADDAAATLISINDDGVSKTHLAMGQIGDGAWLEDRGSTNGTVILDGAGRSVIVPPTQRTILKLPATVILGDTRLTIWRP